MLGPGAFLLLGSPGNPKLIKKYGIDLAKWERLRPSYTAQKRRQL